MNGGVGGIVGISGARDVVQDATGDAGVRSRGRQSMWDLWWTKCDRDRCSHRVFPP